MSNHAKVLPFERVKRKSARGQHFRPETAAADPLRMATERLDQFAGLSVGAMGWFWETDANLRFTYLSSELDRARDPNLPPPASLLGKTRWEVAGVDPEHDPLWRQHLADLRARRAFKDFRYTVHARGGSMRYLNISGLPFFDQDGNFLGYRGVATEETETVQANRRAEAAESLLRDAVESISEGFIIFDAEDRFVTCNSAYRALYPRAAEHLAPGVAFEEVLRRSLAHGEVADARGREEEWIRERMAQHHRTGGAVVQEIDGGRWLLVTERRMRNGGIAGLRMDITAQKTAEAALRRSEERFALAIAGANDGIWDWDVREGRVFRSPRVLEFLGLGADEAEVTQEVAMASTHPEDVPRYQDALARFFRGETSAFECEYRVRHMCGEYRWISNRAQGLRDGEGRVYRMTGSLRDITEQKQAEARIQRLAFYDSLTELPNQALLNDRIAQALASERRVQSGGALLLVELADFKDVVASLGMAKGDALLVAVAQRLGGMVRPGDTVARCGTCQFALLLRDIDDPEGLTGVLNRLLTMFGLPFSVGDSSVHVSVGIGIATLPMDGTTPDLLMRNATTALANVRPADLNPYQFYREDMTAAATRRLTLQEELRLAIERQELEVYYEPQVDPADERVIGAEALVRWQHPQLGMIPPNKFIPIAERSGLIAPLGDLVLRAACRQVRAWQLNGLPTFPISVNVSREQFRGGDFAANVRSILYETGLPPDQLILELTESTILQNPDRVVRSMDELSALGVRFAIDDFGIDHSALGYLARLPIHEIKIDMAFVSRMTTDPKHAALVQAIVSMAKVMRKQTVAEGVETAEQKIFLRAYGCDALQGYLFGKAMAADHFETLLRRQAVA